MLEEAYRFCERARNARYLQTAQPSDALPGDRAELERLALLLGYVHRPHSVLRDDYRRVTRRARASSSASSTTPDVRRHAWKRWAVPGAIALAVLPLVVSAIALVVRVGGDYRPSPTRPGSSCRSATSATSPVLLGPYSRFGWFHPGPILYYLLWLPYRITGSTGVSLVVAALTLNAVVGRRASRSSPADGAGCRSCCSRCSSSGS